MPKSPRSYQCRDITQYLTASVKELGIGSYVSEDSTEGKTNPFYPLATATLQTTVFDVVHLFSEQGISAVPIVDEAGKVVNLYETVDVIVSDIPLPEPSKGEAPAFDHPLRLLFYFSPLPRLWSPRASLQSDRLFELAR